MIGLFVVATASDKIEYCVYNTKKNLCQSSYGEAIQAKNVKNMTAKSGFDVKVNIVENIEEKINLNFFKKANEVHIKGQGGKFKFGFESDEFIYPKVQLESVICIKDDTMSFFMRSLILVNVTFIGFEKRGCFYTQKLETDLLSTANTTFNTKDTVIHCDWKESFIPNFKVDGCVWTDRAIFVDILDKSEIDQYGSHLIITPVSQSMGYRRTNFRRQSGEVEYVFNISEGTVVFGSLFSSQSSSFNMLNVNLENSKMLVKEGHWHGHEKFIINSNNSLVEISDTQPNFNFVKLEATTFILNVPVVFPEYNLSLTNNVTFKGNTELTIYNIFMSNNDVFTSDALKNHIVNIICQDKRSTVNFRGEGYFCIQYVPENVECVDVYNFYTKKNTNLELSYNTETDHYLKIRNEFNDELNTLRVKLNWGQNQLPEAGAKDFYKLVEHNYNDKEIQKKIRAIVDDSYFPIKGTFKVKVYGIEGNTMAMKRSSRVCIAPNDSDQCGFLSGNYVVYNKDIKLSDLIESGEFATLMESKGMKITITRNNFNFLIDSSVDELTVRTANNAVVNATIKPKININYLTLNGVTFDVETTTKYELLVKVMVIKNSIIADRINQFVSFNKVEELLMDSKVNDQFDPKPTPKYYGLYTDKIIIEKTGIKPQIPHSSETSMTFVGVRNIVSNSPYKSSHIYLYIIPDQFIKFEGQDWGNVSFILRDHLSNDDVAVYYEKTTPFHIMAPNTKYTLYPDFFGMNLKSNSLLCAKQVDFNVSEEYTITLGENSLNCNEDVVVNVSIVSPTISTHMKVDGVVSLPHLTLQRSLLMYPDTLFTVDEFANPDDDFLIYFNYTLHNFPRLDIKRYLNPGESSFRPSMQMYAFPSKDDKEFITNPIYKMGIPFLCIYESEYKGHIFQNGLLFTIPNQTTSTSSRQYRIGQEAGSDICVYMVPYVEPDPPVHKIGPDNKAPWIIIIVLSALLLVALVVALWYTITKKPFVEQVDTLNTPIM